MNKMHILKRESLSNFPERNTSKIFDNAIY